MATCRKKTPESSWEEPPLLNPKIHAGRAGPAIAVKTLLKGLSRFLRHLRLAGFNEGVFWFSRKRMLMIVCSPTVDVKDDKARVPPCLTGSDRWWISAWTNPKVVSKWEALAKHTL